MTGGAIKSYTIHYSFAKINFDFPRWHTYEWDNWDLVDATLAAISESSAGGDGDKGDIVITDGVWRLDADLQMPAKVTFALSTTAKAGFNIGTGVGVAPTTPTVGDVWFDGYNIHYRGGFAAETLATTDLLLDFQTTSEKGDPNGYASLDGTGKVPLTQLPPLGGSTAGSIAFTPTGNIAATDVQAAIAELDTEKVAKAGDTMTGMLTVPAGTGGVDLGIRVGATYSGLWYNTAAGALQVQVGGSTYFSVTAASPPYVTASAQMRTMTPTTTAASLRIPHGVAPTTPVNGDMWSTTLGLYVHVNGTTVGPLGVAGGATAATTSYAPGGNIVATNVQTAITELDNEKAPYNNPVFSGRVSLPAPLAGVPGVNISVLFGTPSVFTDGDIWVTNVGMFVRVNGATVGPLGTGGGGGTATGTTFTPYGHIAATNVQTAIEELVLEKATLDGSNTFTGSIKTRTSTGGADLGIQIGAIGYGISYNSGSALLFSANSSTVFQISNGVIPALQFVSSLLQYRAPASTTGSASHNIPHGTAPTTPADGDFWSTTAGFYGRVNGSTVGPFGAAGAGGTATSITFTPAGNVAATNVQTAIAELDTEKVAKAGDTLTGKLNFMSSSAAGAGINIGSGADPTSPSTNDVWSTGLYLRYRSSGLGGSTQTMAYLEGSTYTGKSTFVTSTTSIASIRLPHGVAPTTPVNGDLWSTTAGFYGYVNGVTVGPFGAGGGGGAASSITFTPTGGIAATNVQTAIVELDTEKLSQAQANLLYEPISDPDTIYLDLDWGAPPSGSELISTATVTAPHYEGSGEDYYWVWGQRWVHDADYNAWQLSSTDDNHVIFETRAGDWMDSPHPYPDSSGIERNRLVMAYPDWYAPTDDVLCTGYVMVEGLGTSTEDWITGLEVHTSGGSTYQEAKKFELTMNDGKWGVFANYNSLDGFLYEDTADIVDGRWYKIKFYVKSHTTNGRVICEIDNVRVANKTGYVGHTTELGVSLEFGPYRGSSPTGTVKMHFRDWYIETGAYGTLTEPPLPTSAHLTKAQADTYYEPIDSTLTALAALNSTAGLVEQTGTDAFTKRLIGVTNSTDIPTRALADARYAPIAPNATSIVYTPAGNIAATNVSAAIAELDAEKAPVQPTIVAKGNSSTTTQTFVVATSKVQTVTVTGAHTWAITWPAGYSDLEVAATNAGAFAITMPTVNWMKGDGTKSTTFSTLGVTLQASGINMFYFWTYDGGTTVYGRAM